MDHAEGTSGCDGQCDNVTLGGWKPWRVGLLSARRLSGGHS